LQQLHFALQPPLKQDVFGKAMIFQGFALPNMLFLYKLRIS